MIIITKDFWLENLKDRDGVSLLDFLATMEESRREKIEQAVFAHAKEIPDMYCIPGRPRPMFPERWAGRFGLLYHSEARRLWLAATKQSQDECHDAHNKANDLAWSASHNARDWREQKAYEQESRFWRNRGYDLAGEIYESKYTSPACLI
jgi:hypothetical protein